jgi:PAS domain S-box-containing protein
LVGSAASEDVRGTRPWGCARTYERHTRRRIRTAGWPEERRTAERRVLMEARTTEARSEAGRIRTLHVDDDEQFGEVTADLLEAVEPRLEVVSVTSVGAGLDRLADGDVDCVVSDYDMPGGNGIEFLERVRERRPRLPFILFTGKGSEEVAGDAVSVGVTDYLQKESGIDQYTVLANRIVNATEKYRTETDLERRIVQQEALATLGQDALVADDLTSLFDEAATLVADSLDCDYTKVLEWSADRDELVLRSGVGWEDALVGQTSVPAGDGSQAGYTLVSAEPVVVVDFDEETRFDDPDLLGDHGVVSGISVVIGSVTDPWGVLGTHATERREFTAQDVTFVRNVANVLAAAIDRHRTEERLRESESRFREIAELSPDGIFRTDTEGRFTYVSPASESLLGRSTDDLVGTPFDRVVAAESHAAAREGIERVVGGEVVRELALTLVDADGDPFEVEVSAGPVRRDDVVEVVQGFARDVTEKRERERELQRSRERFQALVDAFPNGGVFLFDENLRYTMAGGDELAAGGLSPETMLGRTPSEVFPPANAEPLEESYRAALSGEKRSFEDSFQGRHYHVQTIPLRDDTGTVIGGMAVAQNVTARLERERELQESRERYRTVVDNFPGGVVLFDHDLRVVAGGGTEFERVDCDPMEAVGEPLRETIVPADAAFLHAHYRAALDGESRTVQYETNGTHYQFQTMPLGGGDGRVTAGMSVVRNVTDRVERDRKLAQLRERSRELMHTETEAETARVAVDAAREVVGASLSGFHEYNDAADRLEPGVMAESVGEVFETPPGYERDAEPGTRAAVVWDVFESGEPRYIADVAADEAMMESSPAGCVLLHPIGRHGMFVVSSPEADAYDETDRALLDILAASLTAGMDRVEREQRLRARERRLEAQNERLSRFASIVSHDLRNPLSVAQGRLKLARTSGDDAHLDAVADAHDRMGRLVDGLLQLTLTDGVGETDPLDLSTVARGAWGSVETAAASLVVDADRVVHADENRLRQLLENLFRNSVEHGSTAPRSQTRGDRVERGSTDSRPAAGESVERESVADRGADDGAAVTVTVGDLPTGFFVEDDGPGIEPERRSTVFEAGYSTNTEGTGLGLRIVADVAAEHGWTVDVTGGTDGGARFEFTDTDSDADPGR